TEIHAESPEDLQQDTRPPKPGLEAPRRPGREHSRVAESEGVERGGEAPRETMPQAIDGQRDEHGGQGERSDQTARGRAEAGEPDRGALEQEARGADSAEVVPGEPERRRQEQKRPALPLRRGHDESGHGQEKDGGREQEAELLVPEETEVPTHFERRPHGP